VGAMKSGRAVIISADILASMLDMMAVEVDIEIRDKT
jgi:hypothetical protein